MKTDRELLELAAKAAWLDINYWISNPGLECFVLADDGPEWNPLTDDGDALRLAVKLNLSIITGWGFDGKPSGSVGAMLGSPKDLQLTNTKRGDDPCDAWRRAIVRAAAAIGESMP